MLRILLVAGLVVVVLAASGYQVLPGRAAETAPVFLVSNADHVEGSSKAPVTVIEYGAPTCPVCARFNAQVISRLKRDYIDKGKVRYVFRVWPRLPSDGPAEKIGRCLPPGKYFAFLDLLFRNQAKWDEEFGVTDPRAGLVALARQVGLGAQKVGQCIADTTQDADINKVAAEGEARYHITGTPTIIVNDKAQPSGDLSWDQLKRLVDAALARK
jgi:protein-disulfide isomerase